MSARHTHTGWLQLLVAGGLALAATVALALAAPSGRAAGVGDCSPGSSWGTPRNGLADEVLALVNEHRASLGVGPLAASPTLAAAAVWKALHMAGSGYFAHDDPAPPVTRSVGDRLAACGYTRGGWGENIAYGYPTARAVVDGWLSSPGHRANIENRAFRSIGVGAAASRDGTIYWVQDFGTEAPREEPIAEKAAAQPAPGAPVARVVRSGRPRAGARFTIVVTVAGTGGRVSCRATLGGRRLQAEVRGRGDTGVACSWRIPRGTRGAILTYTVGVAGGGVRTERTFTTAVS